MALSTVEMRITIEHLPQMKRLFDASLALWDAVQIQKDHIAYLSAFDEWEEALIDLQRATEGTEPTL